MEMKCGPCAQTRLLGPFTVGSLAFIMESSGGETPDRGSAGKLQPGAERRESAIEYQRMTVYHTRTRGYRTLCLVGIDCRSCTPYM